MGIMTPMWCFLQFSRELPTDFVQIWSEWVTLLCPARSGQHSLVHKLESSGKKIKENHSPLQQSVDTRAQLFFSACISVLQQTAKIYEQEENVYAQSVHGRMSPWWSLCTLYLSHARWSHRKRLGSLLLWACSIRDVNCSSAITSHRLLIQSLRKADTLENNMWKIARIIN